MRRRGRRRRGEEEGEEISCGWLPFRLPLPPQFGAEVAFLLGIIVIIVSLEAS